MPKLLPPLPVLLMCALITKLSLRLLVLSVLSVAANSGLAENLPKYRPALWAITRVPS
jgi:hypothetical protein